MADRCPTCHRKHRRSNEANRRYWLLLHVAAEKLRPDGAQYSAEAYHIYYKMKFLGADDVKLPSGKVVAVPKSSADLPKDEFHEYVFKVEQELNERGVFLDDVPQS